MKQVLQEVIPATWVGVQVQSEKDLIFLGKDNLEAIKQEWRREERRYSAAIKSLQTDLDTFKGRTIEDIRDLAKDYEQPDFPRISVRENEEAEPLDADSLNRKRGTTTLNCCGWCNYCTGGETRPGFDCRITTHCRLLFVNAEKRLKFNTPCLVTHGTQELIDEIIQNIEWFLDEAVAEKRKVEQRIRLVMDATKKADIKPCLPQKRPSNYIKAGDKVKIFLGSHDQNILPSKANRFNDGTVVGNGDFLAMDDLVHTGKLLDGYGVSSRRFEPDLLHVWEYEYFRHHRFYLEMWLKWAKENGAQLDEKKYREALKTLET